MSLYSCLWNTISKRIHRFIIQDIEIRLGEDGNGGLALKNLATPCVILTRMAHQIFLLPDSNGSYVPMASLSYSSLGDVALGDSLFFARIGNGYMARSPNPISVRKNFSAQDSTLLRHLLWSCVPCSGAGSTSGGAYHRKLAGLRRG